MALHNLKILCEFPQISITLREYHSWIVYDKFCARFVPKILTVVHKTQRMASALPFLEQCHKDGDEFLSHIIRVTGDVNGLHL
jgi:hypothetical protein